jgi:hypothetical protein
MIFTAAVLPALGKIAADVAARFFPSPEDENKRRELENQVQIAGMQQAAAIDNAAAELIKAEAQGESWLQRNWRPLVMITFTALIVARWLGFAAPNLGPDEVLKLWEIVQLGLGGYVVGRSVEKVMATAADALQTYKKTS